MPKAFYILLLPRIPYLTSFFLILDVDVQRIWSKTDDFVLQGPLLTQMARLLLSLVFVLMITSPENYDSVKIKTICNVPDL